MTGANTRGSSRNREEGNQSQQGAVSNSANPRAESLTEGAQGGPPSLESVDQRLTYIISKLDGIDILKARLGNLTAQVSNNQSELKSLIDTKTRKVREDLQLELSAINRRMEGLVSRVARVEALAAGKAFDPDKTVVIYNISKPVDETEAQLNQAITDIFSQGLQLPGIEIVSVKRCFGTPGPVKVELPNLTCKIEVLRAKSTLKQKTQYSQLYIRSSKSHEERLMEINLKQVLDELDMTNVFRFTGSGRLVRRDETDSSRGHQGRDRGRGTYRGKGTYNTGDYFGFSDRPHSDSDTRLSYNSPVDDTTSNIPSSSSSRSQGTETISTA